MSDIFQEIDEELRQDKAARLWKTYGKYLISLAVCIILGVAGYRFMEHKVEKSRERASELYEIASESGRSGDLKDAIELFSDPSFEGILGYSIISQMQKATLARKNNDFDGMLIALKKIIDDEAIPLYLRDLARLNFLAANSNNNINLAELPYLNALIEENGPWKFMALELKGGLELESGNLESARSIFRDLIDEADTPNSLRRRATEILKALP